MHFYCSAGLSMLQEIIESLLETFAAEIVRRVSAITALDPDDVAALIPGLTHTHYYIATEPVDGCACCLRHTVDPR